VENAGPGSRGTGYRVPGCGKRGVWWKTQSTIFLAKMWVFLTKTRSQNFVSLYCDEYQFSTSASNALLDQQSKLNISWERKPFKSQRVVHCKRASLCYVTHFGTSIYDLKNFVYVLFTCCEVYRFVLFEINIACPIKFMFLLYRVDIRAREIFNEVSSKESITSTN